MNLHSINKLQRSPGKTSRVGSVNAWTPKTPQNKSPSLLPPACQTSTWRCNLPSKAAMIRGKLPGMLSKVN